MKVVPTYNAEEPPHGLYLSGPTKAKVEDSGSFAAIDLGINSGVNEIFAVLNFSHAPCETDPHIIRVLASGSSTSTLFMLFVNTRDTLLSDPQPDE